MSSFQENIIQREADTVSALNALVTKMGGSFFPSLQEDGFRVVPDGGKVHVVLYGTKAELPSTRKNGLAFIRTLKENATVQRPFGKRQSKLYKRRVTVEGHQPFWLELSTVTYSN